MEEWLNVRVHAQGLFSCWSRSPACCSRSPRSAAAQDYPSKPVRLIIPFPPGGSNDVVGRMIALQLSDRLGKQVVVDNRGGAGGVIGTEAAANAPPDGYTLLIISIAHAVSPWLYKLPLRSDQVLRAGLDPGQRPQRAGGPSGACRCIRSAS